MKKDPMRISKKNGDKEIRRVVWDVTNKVYIRNSRSRNTGTQEYVSVTTDTRAQKTVYVRSREGETTQGSRKIRNFFDHSWDIRCNKRLA